jgi:hypothetical protein
MHATPKITNQQINHSIATTFNRITPIRYILTKKLIKLTTITHFPFIAIKK